MGWGDVISIGLGLGNAALNASNAGTLQQMKLQQAGEAVYREFVNVMRNGMFNLKQTAEGVLAGEEASPLQAAGAMRILDHQLSMSGITPDLFSEMADKEYAAATARLISSNSSRMYAALDKAGQAQVDQLLEHMRLLPDSRYYLEHVDQASRLRESGGIVNQNPNARSTSCLFYALGLGGLFLLLPLVDILGVLGSLLILAAAIAFLVVMFRLSKKSRTVKAAQQTVKQLQGDVDLVRFQTLEVQFETPERAKQAQEQSEQYIENFFGDYTLLQDGWRA